MNFTFSDHQKSILSSVDKMINKYLPPSEVRLRDANFDPPDFLTKRYAELGLFSIPFPQKYGGLEDQWMTTILVNERLGYHAAMAASLYATTLGFGGMSILTYGSDYQKKKFIPMLINGDLRFSLALTEPSAGTDAAAIRTRAKKTTNGWVINGRKTWISGADVADYLVTPVRTKPESEGADGISIILIPGKTDGINMTKLEKVGNNCLTSWDIGFQDVFVDEKNLLGEENKGFKNLMSTLHYSRSSQASNAIGQAQKAIEIIIDYVTEREQFGRSLSKFQTVRHRIADMQSRVDQARLILYKLAWMIDQGLRCRKEAAQAKILASECLQNVTHHGMQLMGSAGYSMDNDMQRLWRDSRLYTFGEGANEIQREIVAKEIGL